MAAHDEEGCKGEEDEDDEEGEEEESEEAALELMPVVKATGDRVLTGVVKHDLLQHSPLGVSVYSQTLVGTDLQAAAQACRQLRTAKARAGGGQKYSEGQTYWIGAKDEPGDILERMALEIFQQHTADISLEDDAVQEAMCGAEYWAVVCKKGDDVAPHFDKCYSLEESHKINVHPLLGTVTYLTGVGAPTVVTGIAEDYVPCLKTTEENPRKKASTERQVPFVVSHPAEGKHLTFDGQLLHYADADLAVPGQADAADRVALLVNVWVNHRPRDSEQRKLKKVGVVYELAREFRNKALCTSSPASSGTSEAGPAQGQLMSFASKGSFVDARTLRPGRRRHVKGGGGLWFAGLFADGTAGATLWHDKEFCLGPPAEEGPPKKRKKPSLAAKRREAATRREVLQLVEAGLGVESAAPFLTTRFEGRDERRPEGLA